jgi:hypothetical protein
MENSVRSHTNPYCRKTKLDYESDNGFSVAIWGPATWHLLRIISFNYPTAPSHETKKQYMAFVKSLGDVLPCDACRKNYAKNIKDVGFGFDVMKDRHSFSRFIYDLERSVHKTVTKKDKLHVSFYSRRDQYEHFRAKCSNGRCIIPVKSVPSRVVMEVVPITITDTRYSFSIAKECLQ